MPLTSGDLDYVRDFVRGASAIVLDDKDYLIEARLGTLAVTEGHQSLMNLMIALRQESGERRLHRKVLDALTTNETSFFRDMHPFEAIRKTILPNCWSATARAKLCASGRRPAPPDRSRCPWR